MGALRAAELHRFGMIGVGRIFDWYVSGAIEADDEVAVVHESAERDYRPVSEALVNLRATFLAAQDAGVIGAETRFELVEIGRSIFYPDRSLREVLLRGAQNGIDPDGLARLSDWLGVKRQNLVDQKRLDAFAVLEKVGRDATANAPREGACFDFEYTELWHELTRRVDGSEIRLARAEAGPPVEPARKAAHARTDPWTGQVMDLLRARDPSLADDLVREAERRAALLECAARGALEADPAEIQDASDSLRYARDLFSPASTAVWLEERGLDIADFSSWMREEVLLERARERAITATHEQLRRAIQASREPVVESTIAELIKPSLTHPES